MAIAQVTAGNRIVTSDLNAYYNLLKGAAGETITLIYNAAASLIFQPSSDPSAGTEVLQIKNNAGTVQGSLTYDGKLKAADGTAALPGIRFQSEASGLYLSSAGVIGVAASGATTNILLALNALSIGTNPAAAGAVRLSNNVAVNARNFNNNNQIALISSDTSDNVKVGDTGSPLLLQSSAGNIDFRYAVTALGGGAAPTLGTIGGSGPGTAGQNSWLKVLINGTASFLPVWR